MKRALLLFVLPFLFIPAYGQSAFEINLSNETIQLADRKFYIESVIDNRTEKAYIGTIRQGLLDTFHPILLKGGLSNSLQGYFDVSLSKGNAQTPIQIKVNTLKVGQSLSGTDELGYVDLLLEYYHQSKLLFSNKQHIEVIEYEVTKLHEANIREALKRSLFEFNKSEWLAKVNSSATALGASLADSSSNYLHYVPTSSPYKIAEEQNRNITTIGYQIGGYSMIGFDYEFRLPNNLGFHLGAGYSGYTYGIMIHTSSKRDSPYFNISFKDGGFGLLHAAAFEYGVRWVLNKQTGIGITFQIGVAKILKIDSEIESVLFGGAQTPEFMSSMGIGLSW